MYTSVFIENLRARIRANADLVSNAELMRIANLARLTVDDYVIKENPSLYNMIYTQDLDADVREYRISHTTRNILQVQANLKQTGGDDNWITLMPGNYGVEYQKGDAETAILANFQNVATIARYVRNGNFIYILSGEIVDVTGGLKIACTGRPLDITDPTENTRDLAEYAPSPNFTPGVPLEMQTPWLVLASRNYKLEADRAASLDPEEQQVFELLGSQAIKLRDKTPVILDTTDLNVQRARSDFGFDY